MARPAYADPAPPTHPFQLPPISKLKDFPTALGPKASQILTKSAEVEALGQQVLKLQQTAGDDRTATDTSFAAWQSAVNATSVAEQTAADAVARAYEDNHALGPWSDKSGTYNQLSLAVPGLLDGVTNPVPAGVALINARVKEQAAYNAYVTALTAQQNAEAAALSLESSYVVQNDQLTQMKTDNAAALAAAEAAQNEIDTAIGAGLPVSTNVAGQMASPLALQAIAFAEAQLGKPYVFGAEGPNSFDCSGLVWDAYRSVGVTVPRIAADQYHATTPITIDDLLPGDLVFFSQTSKTNWRSISHVGMYIGDGKMIEAPMTGQNVKIAPVWWSAFYGATRVVPAVAGPVVTPTPTPTPTPRPTPTPTPTPTHSPTPTPTPSSPSQSPSGPPSGSPSGPPSPTPSDTPTPTPSASQSSTPPTPSPSPSNTPSPSPSDTPSTSTSSSAPPPPPPSPSAASSAP